MKSITNEKIFNGKGEAHVASAEPIDFTVFAEGVPTSISYINSERRILFQNNLFEKWWGGSRSENHNKLLEDVLGDAIYKRFQSSVDKALSGERGRAEFATPFKDGTTRIVDITYVPDIALDGRTKGFFLRVEDISDRKQAEQELRLTQDNLKDYLETSSIGLHWVGVDGTILWANKADYDYLGYTREEYVGRNIVDFHADRAVIDDILARLRRDEKLIDYEARLKAKDGSIRHVLINSSVLWNEGEFVHTRCFTVDITDRKRAEAALQKSEQQYRTLLGLLPVAVYACGPSGDITFFNEHAATLWGHAPKIGDADDRFCGSFRLWRTDGTLLPHQQTPMAIALKEGRSFRNEDVIIERPDGARINVLVNIDPVLDSGGSVLGAINAFHDITDRKKIEEALIRQAKELEQFAYVSSHDLQEPLRKVATYVQMLKETSGAAVGEQGEKYIGNILQGTARMQNLIRDLLDYSRLSRQDARRERVDLKGLVARVLDDLENIVANTNAQITVEELPAVMGDPVQLNQLFQNLISNAMKFHGERPPQIEISSAREDGNWIVAVRDNGIGIDPKYRDQIFKVFNRLHSKGKYEGTGIGLAICKKVVEQHGGKIWVDSTPGQGSAFFFSLPEA